MDKLPPEILIEIASFACTDNGTTGRALSLVSKLFRATSSSVKLQSIALHAVSQFDAFAAHLDSLPRRLRRVRYLFVSVDDDALAAWDLYSEEFYADPTAENAHEFTMTGTESLSRILAFIAPTIQILSLILRPCSEEVFAYPVIMPALPDSLPSLSELTISNSYVPDIFYDQLHVATGLRRLHLAAGRISYLPPDFSERVSKHFSLLTHIRLFGVACEAEGDDPIPLCLRGLLSPPSSSSTKSHSGLQYIGILPGVSLRGLGLFFDRDRLKSALDTLEERDTRIVQVYRNVRHELAVREENEAFFDWWVQRVEGKPGCWISKPL